MLSYQDDNLVWDADDTHFIRSRGFGGFPVASVVEPGKERGNEIDSLEGRRP